jgi:tellurite resistance protein
MRWLVPLISAAVGGLMAGWHGAIIGLVVGCIVAAILRALRSDVPPAAAQAPAPPHQRSRTVNPTPPLSPTATPVERLHAHMRQIETSRSVGDNQSKRAMPGIGISLSFGNDETPPPRSGRGASKLTWYAPGQSVIHAGLIIDGGMVYTSERALTWPGEPSAIITSLSVGSTAAHPLVDFGYYPSYDRISEEQRRCYLEWLSAGRKDADPAHRSLGYVFMFFYGLERRIVLDRDRDPVLLEEALRLLQHYGSAHKSRSLKSYFLQLLHFAGWQLGSEAYRALWPRLLEVDGDRPDEDGLRFVLANLHQRGESLDRTVAYRLALVNEESRRSIVVMRAKEKFLALFGQRFNEQFPDGLRVVEAAKQETLVQYRPASSTLAQMSYERQRESPFELRIPNIAALHRQFKALPAIWNSCVDDLSGYSRALTSKKQGQGAARATWQSLPRELRKTEDHPLKPAFDELLTTAPREGDYSFVPTAMLATLVGVQERAKLTTAHSREVAEIADELGWHLAPDPRITGLPLAWNQELALYGAIPGQESVEGLAGPLRLLYLAVTLAAADGVIEPQELDTFYRLIASQVTRESDWPPLRATEASLRRDTNVALRSLPQISKLIPADSRQFVLHVMAHIAAADGEVSLDELKVLRRIARAFELDANSVEKLLREDEAFREVTVAGAEGSSARGEAIPPRKAEKPTIFALNQDRIEALTLETQEVISLLSVVMAEPEEVPCPPSPVAPPQANFTSVEWLNGLEVRYHAAVLSLIRHDQITTNNFDCLAADHHLMPDDLFNAVNTWADEILGDFLLERGENVRIFRNLLPDVAVLSIAA